MLRPLPSRSARDSASKMLGGETSRLFQHAGIRHLIHRFFRAKAQWPIVFVAGHSGTWLMPMYPSRRTWALGSGRRKLGTFEHFLLQNVRLPSSWTVRQSNNHCFIHGEHAGAW